MSAPKLPFDAFRVTTRTEGDTPSGVTVTRVQVRELYPNSKMALIRYGRRLHSEMVCPFGELFSAPAQAIAYLVKTVPTIRYLPRKT